MIYPPIPNPILGIMRELNFTHVERFNEFKVPGFEFQMWYRTSSNPHNASLRIVCLSPSRRFGDCILVNTEITTEALLTYLERCGVPEPHRQLRRKRLLALVAD